MAIHLAAGGTTMSIGLGFIGVGKHGRCHLREFAKLPDAALRLACDPHAANLRLALDENTALKAAPDAMSLVADPSVDAVVISTPAESHLEMVELALAAGKHVLVEKPLAHEPAAARAIATAAAKHPACLVMVGHCERFNTAYRDAHHAVTSGEIGTPRFVSASRLAPLQLCDPTWHLGPLDTAVHDIDLMLWLMRDRPESVSARAVSTQPGETWSHVSYDITFANGGLAQGHIGWIDLGRSYPMHSNAHPRLFLDGTQGCLSLDLWQRPVTVHNRAQDTYFYADNVILGYGDYPTLLTAQNAAFLKAIATDSPSPMPADDAALALEVAFAAWQSARNHGMPVPL
jgi:myo-inositol 2-dehydrogenase / D-chiro-inositol 1-dehydrogenase